MSYEELRDRRRRLLADAIRKQRWAKLKLPDGPALGLVPLRVVEKDLVAFFEGAVDAVKKHGPVMDINAIRTPLKPRAMVTNKPLVISQWPKHIDSIVEGIKQATGLVAKSFRVRVVNGPTRKRVLLSRRPTLIMGATRTFSFTDDDKEIAVADPNDHPMIRGNTLHPFIMCNTVQNRRCIMRGNGGRTLFVFINT